MNVYVKNGTLSESETQAYIQHCQQKYHDREITSLTITVDGDYVDLECEFKDVPFVRLRRITGYLTDSLERWNNGKKAEEHDRVKHTITED